MYSTSWAGVFDGVCVTIIMSVKERSERAQVIIYQMAQRSVNGVSPPVSCMANSEVQF